MDPRNEKVAVVFGTRPEIIKLADVVHELGDIAHVVHTGQHYDPNMSAALLDQAGVTVDAHLTGVGGRSRAAQVATGIDVLAQEFERVRPSAVIVQGDTNTVSAGAQAANYLDIPVIHVEAGLRSWDRAMPEETNRLVTGVLADVHCAATEHNAANLRREGVPDWKILVTGNPIVEATWRSVRHAGSPLETLLPAGPARGSYVLSTIHRPENTDTREALERVLVGLGQIGLPVVLVAHPRTVAAIARHGLEHLVAGPTFTVLEPVDHADFLTLARDAALLVADSGGLQEEATVIGKPLVVVRRSTERPESVDAGFARLAGPDQDLATTARAMIADWLSFGSARKASPYGDGSASRRIAAVARNIALGAPVEDAVARVRQEQHSVKALAV